MREEARAVYIEFNDAIKILEQQYSELVFNTLKVRNIDDPVYMMPQPVPPHYRGDIVISAGTSYKEDQEYHYHDYFVAFYPYRGDYTFNIMGKNIVLHEGEICLFQPLVGHKILQQADPNNVLFTIRFRKSLLIQSLLSVMPKSEVMLDFFLAPFWSATTDPHYYLVYFADSPYHASVIRNMVEIIVQEYVNMLPDYDTLLDSACTLLFSALSRCTVIHGSGKKNIPITASILQYINRNCATVTLDQIAEKYSYNANYLSVLLRKDTGKTFSEILRTCRLQRACTLLGNSDFPIERIALLSGYPHNSYFFKTFKSVMGVTPTQYRETVHNSHNIFPE